MRAQLSWLEHMVYTHGVTGSNPVVRTKYAAVAQLGRALDCHSRGRGFEPRQPLQRPLKVGVMGTCRQPENALVSCAGKLSDCSDVGGP